MKVSREAWLEVEPLLAAALDMEPAARAAWLAGIDAKHPSVAPILRRMLQSHDRAMRSRELETVPKLAPWPLLASPHGAGERVGPFALERMLGRGGMGEVWLARQADGRVERAVALKLPVLHQAGEGVGERFRRERDMLARLEHPHIARLYDAGVTEAGQPWLAMEYVEGLSLSEYVASRPLSIAERLGLFRQVLGAVAHAHRFLIVHRDLKPPNIIIDGAGQVRLLDFGIAKLVEERDDAEGAPGDVTRAGGRMMTLRYAAPEQVASGAITTATDIYSLGVILHELLTGLAPYRAVRDGKPLTEALLLQEPTTVPSRLALSLAAARGCGLASPRQLARRLSGDLDAIVLKAMRRDPAERYASVERFAEDIAAHLERRPVKARAGTWRYLAGRFALRHKLPLALAGAVVATLGVGLVLAEQERRVAVAERARAEKHFASVRKLANAFIFDVHGEIQNLPGALKAREMLVRTSLQYLDALVGESGNDPALMAELAAAYRKIGNIQGEPGAANKGDPTLAIGNFEKAKGLFTAIDRVRPDDIAILREHASLSYTLARAWFLRNDPRWQAEIAQAVRLAERVAALPQAQPRDRGRVASAIAEQAHLTSLKFGQGPEVDAAVARAIAIAESLARELPGDTDVAMDLVATHQRAGGILIGGEWTPESVRRGAAHLRRALDVIEVMLAPDPGNVRLLWLRADSTTWLAQALLNSGDVAAADRTIGVALARGAELLARDPGNVQLITDNLSILVQATLIAHRAGDQARSTRHGREALALAARLPDDVRNTRDARNAIAEASTYLGYALLATASEPALGTERRLALLTEARTRIGAGAAFIAEIRTEGLGSFAERDAREIEAALARCDEAIARLRRG